YRKLRVEVGDADGGEREDTGLFGGSAVGELQVGADDRGRRPIELECGSRTRESIRIAQGWRSRRGGTGLVGIRRRAAGIDRAHAVEVGGAGRDRKIGIGGGPCRKRADLSVSSGGSCLALD